MTDSQRNIIMAACSLVSCAIFVWTLIVGDIRLRALARDSDRRLKKLKADSDARQRALDEARREFGLPATDRDKWNVS